MVHGQRLWPDWHGIRYGHLVLQRLIWRSTSVPQFVAASLFVTQLCDSIPVCLHASFSSFGPVQGGPATAIDAFLEAGCTILVPTFSFDFSIPPPIDMRPKRNGWDYQQTHPASDRRIRHVFSTDSNEISQDAMGTIPTAVLSRPGRVRGNHPLCSFAAIGPMAEALTMTQTGVDVFAPLRALARACGRVVLMGLGLGRMTLLHAAEELAGRRPFIRWANGANGKAMAVTMGGCSDGFEQLESILAPLAWIPIAYLRTNEP